MTGEDGNQARVSPVRVMEPSQSVECFVKSLVYCCNCHYSVSFQAHYSLFIHVHMLFVVVCVVLQCLCPVFFSLPSFPLIHMLVSILFAIVSVLLICHNLSLLLSNVCKKFPRAPRFSWCVGDFARLRSYLVIFRRLVVLDQQWLWLLHKSHTSRTFMALLYSQAQLK